MADTGWEDRRGKLSEAAYERASRILPGGVNSPVRAFGAVGGTPFFTSRAKGARITDIDGREYVDYVLSWGPLIAGHAHPEVVAAVASQAELGTSYGTPTELETELAEEVARAYPSVEMVRMVNSGTEATMSALRLARAFTGRPRILKFTGCYHGSADSFLIRAGSGAATFGLPDSPGVPAEAAALTLTVPFNDAAAVREVFSRYGEEIAAAIVEPIAGNMGLVLPVSGFLEDLRAVTREFGALLIFDEVMTGFRAAYGGAQEIYGIQPDLTTLGKVIGGGMPVGAYGGRRSLMERVAPLGPVYQAGTLSGNPLAMAAGLATLKLLRQPEAYGRLSDVSRKLALGIAERGRRRGVAVQSAHVGGMFGIFFSADPVRDYDSANRSDKSRYGRFFHGLLRRGVYFAPSQFEAGFVSLAHSDAEVGQTLDAADEALGDLAAGSAP